MKLKIEKVVYQGFGLSRTEGKVIFTPYVLQQETVRVKIVKEDKHLAYADLVEVITPASSRIKPKCEYFTLCGGCHYQHIEYAEQLKIKQEQIIESLRRVGKITIDNIVKPPLPSPRIYYYRNKAVFHTFWQDKKAALGYYSVKGPLIKIDNCPLLEEGLNQKLPSIREELEDYSLFGEITLRIDEQGNCCQGNVAKVNILGKSLVLDLEGFFQVNYHILPQLIETVREACALTGVETVLDAYCGIGLFGLFLAPSAKKVIGIEKNEQAIAYAKTNAQSNSCYNIEFLAGEVEKILPSLEENFTVMIIDPPRSGCSKALLREISHHQPQRIIYISCDPVTLARDLKILIENHYKLDKIQPLDLFPQTYHIETVTALSRF